MNSVIVGLPASRSSLVCSSFYENKQLGARPDSRCDMRPSRVNLLDYNTQRNSTVMFTFTSLQHVLSEFAPDSHSVMKPASPN